MAMAMGRNDDQRLFIEVVLFAFELLMMRNYCRAGAVTRDCCVAGPAVPSFESSPDKLKGEGEVQV